VSVFLDTNVLLYSLDTADTIKRDIALALLARREAVLSVQVLQEFYVQATHTRRAHRLSHKQAAGLVESWSRFQVIPNTFALLRAGFNIRDAAQISLWDALIIAAAAAAGCNALMTEDLNAGQNIAGVTIVNPFA
jgi:predicted nucleic acid-binding protein